MITTAQVRGLLTGGGDVLGEDGTRIGSIGQVYLDDRSSEPEWVTTRTGLFGGGESFVPLAGATVQGDDVRVPFSKDTVKGAPRVEESEGHLSPEEEDELYRYYGVTFAGPSTTGQPTTGQPTERGTVGHDSSGPVTDDAMTRSEERLQVGTETVRSGTARLRKYVVTEDVTRTVPVSRQQLRIEREPITEAHPGNAARAAELTAEEHEIVLHEERVLVSKETVPVERVRLGTSFVTEQQTVTEEVRKEHIEVDGTASATEDAITDRTTHREETR
ncbi:MAG TPA: PRC and DUF2382 domain-containing protein [Nocardioidaceae bacterium]|nr:PRC and DUF2382 domain-containing protein [Nocardioidaceae bacterium]